MKENNKQILFKTIFWIERGNLEEWKKDFKKNAKYKKQKTMQNWSKLNNWYELNNGIK